MSRRPVTIALLVLAVLVLAVVVVKVLDEVGDPDPHAGGLPLDSILNSPVPAKAPFQGLGAVHAAIGFDHCMNLVVADTLEERAAGLRGHAGDLGPYDGMLFVFQGESEAEFTMSGVSNPLEIAFFDADGERNSTRVMKPCPEKAETECPVYQADGPYRYAVETKPGHLPAGPITACSPS
jgi:uncharacterized membrane protein (UPF0127 family)